MNSLRLLDANESLEIAKKLWNTESMQKYLVENYDFYETKDGLIIELEKVKKISIDKTLYYNDLYDAPTINEQNFINYNMSNDPGRNLDDYLEEKERLQTQGCATGRYDYNGIYFRSIRTDHSEIVAANWFDDKDQYFQRYLTQEEEQDYIQLTKERQEQYLERLKKYYKRYGKHITTYGYWADR